MNYKTAAAFRTALESRLLAQSKQTGAPLVRLRKSVAFDRLLVRLMLNQPGQWMLKGGFALQLRLENSGNVRPRTTRDVDLQANLLPADVHRLLVQAARLDLGDWVQFDILAPTLPSDDEGALEQGALRSQAQMYLDGRSFESFNIDIGLRGPLSLPADLLPLPPLLEFAGIVPVQIPCYPLAQHIAEKVHAYTRSYASGASTRVKDLIDLLLIAELDTPLASDDVRRVLQQTFEERGASAPLGLPDPPATWARPYRELARHVNLRQTTLAEGIAAAREFLDPVLTLDANSKWQPKPWRWV